MMFGGHYSVQWELYGDILTYLLHELEVLFGA